MSRDILERRRDVDGVPQEKLEVAPNGTPVPHLQDDAVERENVIGSVGRLVKEKDYPMLVEAMSLLVKRGHKWRLEIVGEGPAKPDIEKAIRDYAVSDYVELAGVQQDVGSWLNRWSIFASSSIQEGQPMALLEAMAHGLPCVATAVGGVPDTLADKRQGLVVPSGNATDFSNALHSLIENREKRIEYGQAARQRAVREFSIDALADRCLEIYKSELAGKGN